MYLHRGSRFLSFALSSVLESHQLSLAHSMSVINKFGPVFLSTVFVSLDHQVSDHSTIVATVQ